MFITQQFEIKHVTPNTSLTSPGSNLMLLRPRLAGKIRDDSMAKVSRFGSARGRNGSIRPRTNLAKGLFRNSGFFTAGCASLARLKVFSHLGSSVSIHG
ncbi:MAG TPA: hypothetical protein VMJ12_02315 [Candidatus Acidoferrales bacterium]|nr:hypothetical protein [Candidatus Acidoferrales bacterium]